MNTGFQVKDSGKRAQFDSGMVRDTNEHKTDYTNLLHGPMFDRWAEHLTKAKSKYPDPKPGVPNWTLAAGEEELARFRESAFRHFRKWLRGERDEDHAAAVFFNINGAEYVLDKMKSDMWPVLRPGPGAVILPPNYAPVNEGDILQPGDEYLQPGTPDKWVATDGAGLRKPLGHTYRRKVR